MDRRLFLKLSAALSGSMVISTGLTGCSSTAGLPENPVSFSHGVASGDPSADSIILWTRAVPAGDSPSATIFWEIAADSNFSDIIRSGHAKAIAARDYTIKVDVRELSPSTRYFYRFSTATETSPAGKTLTLPAGQVDNVKLGLFSCSNYPAGFFTPYLAASADESIDFVLHLGDYIYEYAGDGYATERAAELGRTFAIDNDEEIITLADYRNRYAIYRTDKGLKALHQNKPWIVVWDDHEVANDTYTTGAENHQPDEGDFFQRRAAAVQAYYEWLPIRPPVSETDPTIYRTFEFGDLLSLYMLDTRIIGRDKQLSYAAFTDEETGQFDDTGFTAALMAEDRTMLGLQQRDWLFESLEKSKATWQVLGQQVLMGKMFFPAEIFSGTPREEIPSKIHDLADIRRKQIAGQPVSDEETARLNTTMAYNLDAWDGYPAERETLYKQFREKGKAAVVFAGDTHNGWCNKLTTGDNQAVGIEFGTSSVSSPGMESYLTMDNNEAHRLAQALPLLVKDLEYCNLNLRGYMTVTFTPQEVEANWLYVSSISSEDVHIASVHTARFTQAELLS